MTFAIIEAGGKQYKVAEGDTLVTEKLEGETGGEVTFENVLLVADEKDTSVGTPYVDGASVKATLEETDREKKIDVIRFQAKSRHFRKYGHRQPYSKLKIEEITSGGKKASKKAATKKAATKKTAAKKAASKTTTQKSEG